MAQITRATTPAELDRLSDVLHDSWMDIEEISFEQTTKLISIPIQKQELLAKEGDEPPGLFDQAVALTRLCYLRLFNVQRFELLDSEKMQFYDLTAIRFDPKRRKLEFKTGVPLTLNVFVSCLEVELEETGTILQSRRGRTALFDLISRPFIPET